MQNRNDVDEGIRARLRSLLERYPQAEIARRCNTTPSNVSRYLRDTKIPAEFCAAAIKGLGVNPSWLLAGEGAPMLSDISAETGGMGAGVLQLVDAMNAVARVRLGALTGKQHAQTLRELNDALILYEKLKAQLSAQSRQTFKDLINGVSKSIEKADWKVVDQLMTATDQISRLSEDHDLKMEMLSLKAYSEMVRGNAVNAAELQRKVFAGTLANTEHFGLAAFDHAKRLAMALDWLGRSRDAIGICRAALALGGRRCRNTLSYVMTKFMLGAALARIGKLRKGLSIIQRVWPQMPPERQEPSSHVFAYYLLLSASIGLQEAIQMSAVSNLARETLGLYALWTEDTRTLRTVAEMRPSGKQILPDEDRRWSEYLAAVADVTEGRRSDMALKLLDDWPMSEVGPDQKITLVWLKSVYTAQLERLGGNRAKALQMVLGNEAATRKWTEDQRADVMVMAIHYNSALKLADDGNMTPAHKALCDKARRFFVRKFKQGYGCFRTVVPGAIVGRASIEQAYKKDSGN